MTRMRTTSVGVVSGSGPVVIFVHCGAQQPVAPLAIPAQIVATKKVFISNRGVDSASPVVAERAVGPNDPYNQFFVTMKAGG
jgi:hypothetical protein